MGLQCLSDQCTGDGATSRIVILGDSPVLILASNQNAQQF